MERRLDAANKSAAKVQITAEQLIREASSLSRFDEPIAPPPPPTFTADLNEYKAKKRKDYEDIVRRRRIAPRVWIAYGKWEAELLDFERSRSVFERALSIDYENADVWNAYIDTELKYNFKNSARNILERVCHLLPRISHFWLRYILLEDDNVEIVRKIFRKWLNIDPSNLQIWLRWLKYEIRRDPTKSQIDEIIKDLIESNPQQLDEILKYSHKLHLRIPLEKIRNQRIVEYIRECLAEGKERRLRHANKSFTTIGQVLENLPCLNDPQNHDAYYDQIRILESMLSIRIDDAITRNLQPKADEEEAAADDFELEELKNSEAVTYVKKLYETVLTKGRPLSAKGDKNAAWKKWFYICMRYVLFEEFVLRTSADSCEGMYQNIRTILTKNEINFNKFFRIFASFYLRHGDVQKARLVFGDALGRMKGDIPLAKVAAVFESYIDMELRLDEVDRCRKIAAVCVQKFPNDASSWLTLIDIEILLNEHMRARKLFEIALNYGGQIHDVNTLWKAYIDVEVSRGDLDYARSLFEKQFAASDDVQVLIGLLEFEWQTSKDCARAREAAIRAINVCKQKNLPSERAAVTQIRWLMEKDLGTYKSIEEAEQSLPTRVRKRRKRNPDDDQYEEYTAYIFPDDRDSSHSAASSARMLEAAKRFQAQRNHNSLDQPPR